MGLEGGFVIEPCRIVRLGMLGTTCKGAIKSSCSVSYALDAVPLLFDFALVNKPTKKLKTSSAVDALAIAVAKGFDWLGGHCALQD